jgi:hypothetical protein
LKGANSYIRPPPPPLLNQFAFRQWRESKKEKEESKNDKNDRKIQQNFSLFCKKQGPCSAQKDKLILILSHSNGNPLFPPSHVTLLNDQNHLWEGIFILEGRRMIYYCLLHSFIHSIMIFAVTNCRQMREFL